MYTRLVFSHDESCLFLNPKLNNLYFMIFISNGFLTAWKHLVIFLKTLNFVHWSVCELMSRAWSTQKCPCLSLVRPQVICQLTDGANTLLDEILRTILKIVFRAFYTTKSDQKSMKNLKNIREDSTQTVYGVFFSFD